ncbi:type II secretion system protein E [Xylanimonas cellulosilytica DSM 15894]|uniref:Type II secretion system protein E n=1 Tax=Xylanimonas cellulosilytica (strain DSM 15894 / JCM 12276 / CECT 5975 / KCTC 9989 / LMG 20990 / NBRC 107835 / XIL07) TaxID=446471 RepID=D1BY33_XYLCX|nr:CpaF/VirB11 family protein [Xylanimonas cellulosilytica]ACZ29876.1 type II secretion system protein E [Xylanimonas cellulosilytica DSM 15894]
MTAIDGRVPRVEYGTGPAIDWALVARLRATASEQLSEQVSGMQDRLDAPVQQELGRSIIVGLIESEMADRVRAGRPGWSPGEQRALQHAVFDALFRLGRLQSLVDDDEVESVHISGHDKVVLERTDGSVVLAPPVADSDEELIDFLVFLASRSQVNARTFSPAQPRLHMRLDDGSRLAATAWVTLRPEITIRRHRLITAMLPDLVARGLMTPLAASFLAAAVKAHKSIVVTGAQGAGKTTLMRALCAEIDFFEIIGTFETEYELHLHEFPERHLLVRPWEARPGTGELLPDGRQAGEFTLNEELFDSFRFGLSRQIVGEVRGPEIWVMIKAMESGHGSLSTTHSRNARLAIDKLITCAMEAGPHVTEQNAAKKLAQTIDLIVHLDLARHTLPDGTVTKRRRVSEIVSVQRGEGPLGIAFQDVFALDVDRQVAVPNVLPDDFDDLADHGFDLGAFRLLGHREQGDVR